MQQTAAIRFIPRAQLDTKKWDSCIDDAGGFPLYAYHFYLDVMCRQWDALVLNDYEAIMPLTWHKKAGIYYLYQPFLTLQLGIIGKMVNAEIVHAFLKAIPERFRFWEINLNKDNLFTVPDFTFNEKKSYLLSLQPSYAAIAMHYRQNVKRNIKKAVAAGCAYKEEVPADEVLRLAYPQLKKYTRLLKNDLSNFHKLYNLLMQQQKAKTIGVFHNHKLVAACIFFFYEQRAYYILAANSAEGKKVGASHFLVDRFIQQNAGEQWILDFTGSDIPSIAFFYECFGAQPEPFTSIRLNHLPFWIKWMKK